MDEKKIENNAELFFDVTNLFNNSIPINLKKENYGHSCKYPWLIFVV